MSLDGGTEQMRWALSMAPMIGSPAFRVLIGLLTYRNRESGTAWPAAATLGKRCSMSTSAVDKALRSLRDAGVIEIVATRKASAGWGTKEYAFTGQPLSVSIEPQPLSVSIEPTPQPLSEVTEPSVQVLSEVTEPQPLSEVTEPVPASVEIEDQPLSKSTDKPLEEPQILLSSLPTTSPVEDWTGPTSEDLDWLASELGQRVGDGIEPDTITAKVMLRDEARRSSSIWRSFALGALMTMPRREDLASTFTASAVAGDEKPRVRDDEWKPDIPTYQSAVAKFHLLKDPKVAHEITRQFLDWAEKLDKKPKAGDVGWACRTWLTFVENNYEEATRGHVALRHSQMTGTE